MVKPTPPTSLVRRLVPRVTRRRALAGLGGLVAAVAGIRFGLPAWVRHAPPQALPDDLQQWVDACFSDVDRTKLWDVHAHLLGRGVGTDCFVSEELQSWKHPWKNFQFEIYAAAAGVPTEGTMPDSAYVERLIALHKLGNPQGRLLLMGFDMFFDVDGNPVRERSEFYTPNEYVLAVARAHPDVVVPCASIHPYRKDAIDRLVAAIEQGARAVKWLPNAMHIDHEAPQCAPFFRVLADRKIPLITHTGDEQAVDARDLQILGDPKKLRVPLDAGVTVVAAHVATTGLCAPAPSCREALRAMFAKWPNLYADISAVTQFNRAGAHLASLLRDAELHPRLVNGSDYPLPAVDPLVSTRFLVNNELLSSEDRAHVNRVFPFNPLLFDYVLKRKVRALDSDGKEHRFPPRVFETSWLFEGTRA